MLKRSRYMTSSYVNGFASHACPNAPEANTVLDPGNFYSYEPYQYASSTAT
ncbi:hypothetical protein [Ferrimicrobium acidiphilum]|uniref:hypothetical protein n=1 Tax=Ferrimicrobium acidiphilum TaxID=121039 RepID=UPI0023F591A5|nr:hypothetical protein [Ferrimicrobium acidiphilum]